MPRRLLALIVSTLALLQCAATAAHAAPPDPRLADAWRWSHFTRASGLPSDFVTAAYDVPDDGPWALTRDGIARFDGFRWNRVPVPGGLDFNPQGIVADERHAVVVVARGQLLVGDRTGLRVVPIVENGATVTLTACARAVEGPVLLLETNGALYEWNGLQVRRHSRPGAPRDVRDLKQGGTGVWASAEGGLWSWDGASWRPRLPANGLELRGVADFGSDALAYIDLPMESRGLWEWNGAAHEPSRRTPSAPIDTISTDAAGTVAVHGTGHVVLRNGSAWAPLSDYGVRLDDARSAGFLRNGDLWVAADDGLHVCRLSARRWEAFATPRPDDLNTVNAIVRQPDGRLLVGTGHGVIDVGTDAHITGMTVRPTDDLGTITGLAVDRRGRLWAVSGYSFTGARWRDDRGRWHVPRLDPALDGSFLHRVVADRSGNIWFLGLSAGPSDRWSGPAGPGAFRLIVSASDEPDRIERWGRTEGLPSGRVYGFSEGPDGSYWFATAEGLSRWHAGRWSHWTEAEELKSNRVFTVAVDRKGRAWFAHQVWLGVGMIENGRVSYFTTVNGLATDAIWEIQIDEDDRPWVAGEGGVSFLHEGGWTSFGRETGLAHTRFWPLLKAGSRVFLGSRGGGLVVLDTSDQITPPPIVVPDAPALDESGLMVRWRAFAWWGEVAPEGVLTRVRLDDGAWTPWSVERQQWFHAVPAGTHRITFQSKGPLGKINGRIAPLVVRVPPPLVRRPIFYIPVAALTVLVVGLLVVLTIRQRRHHRALFQREEQLARTFQASPLACAITRFDDGRLIEVNRALTTMSGRSREQLIGKTVIEAGLVVEEYGRSELKAALEAGRAVPPIPLRARAASGELRELVAYSDLVDFGRTRAILTQLLDVTELRRLEGQLRQAQKMESIGRLAGGVAHDFNNLLTVILGNASLLDDELPPGDPRHGAIEQIKIAGDRAERLTRQLLAFARRQVVEPRVLSVNDVVMRTDQMLRRLIGADIELVTLPSPDVDHVLIDPNQLDQVILNMAVNARDAMPDGGTLTIRTHNVTVSEHDAGMQPEVKPGPYVRLSISDTGTGMDSATQARLFEPFFTTKEPGKGTGLGLATCYGVVRQANGHILVESAVGRGTTFHVDLPPAPDGARPGETRERPVDSRGGAETILVVEDEVQVRKLAAAVLRHRGYEVLEAADGLEALQLCGQYRGRLDILVTDIVMPHMRGTELAARLRAARSGLKVLYVSGYTDDGVFRREAGTDRAAFLPKPFTPAALARKVREILDGDAVPPPRAS